MKRPLKNVLSLVAGDAASRLIGFLITAYLARVLAPSSFGIINIGMAVLGYLALLGSPGIQIVEARNAAAFKGSPAERVEGVLTMRLVLAMALTLLTWLLGTFMFGPSLTARVTMIYAATLLPMALLLDWFFQGKEAFAVVSLSRTAQYAVFAVSSFFLIKGEADVILAPAAFVLGTCVAALAMLVVYRLRYGKLKFRWRPALWGSIARQNLPVGGAMILAQMVTNLPPLVVGYVLTTSDVGIYSAAMKLVFLLLFLDRLVNALFLPVVTRYATARADELPFLLGLTVKVLLLVFLPVGLLAVLFAREAMVIVFGAGYGLAVPLFQLLTVYVLLTLVNSVFVCTLIGAGREMAYSRVTAWGAGFLSVAVILLTPLLGTLGAAFGVIAGEGFVLTGILIKTREVTRLPSLSSLSRPVAAAAVMAATAFALYNLSIVGAGVVSLGAYVAVVTFSGGITREEVRFLRERFM